VPAFAAQTAVLDPAEGAEGTAPLRPLRPYCTFADEAVELLRARGFQARRLELGLPDWREAGYPVGAEGNAAGGESA